MRLSWLLFLCLFSLLHHTLQLTGTMCNIIDKNALFTLTLMMGDGDYVYEMPDNSTIYFQFCSYVDFKCTINSRNSYATHISGDEEECHYLTADQKWSSQNEDKQSGYIVSLLDPESPQNGVSLEIFDGDIYSQNLETNVTLRYSVKFNIECSSEEGITNKFTTINVTQDKNQYVINGKSKSGCPVLQFSEIWNYLSNHKIIFAIVLIIVGAAECFFGLKILPVTLFVIGYFTGFGVLIAILGEFVISPGTNVVVVWVILMITVFFGLLLGYVTTSLRKLGFFFLGFWLGTVIAFLLNNAFLYKMNDTNIALWVAICVLGTFFGMLSCFFYKHIVIISTATVGAYALIRPFGWIASGFPNEFAIAQQIRYNQLTEIPNEFYLYLALILVMAVIGTRFQYYYYYHNEELDKEFQLDDKGNDLDEDLIDDDENDDEEGHGEEEEDEDENGKSKKKGKQAKKNQSKNVFGWVKNKLNDIDIKGTINNIKQKSPFKKKDKNVELEDYSESKPQRQEFMNVQNSGEEDNEYSDEDPKKQKAQKQKKGKQSQAPATTKSKPKKKQQQSDDIDLDGMEEFE